MSRHLGQAPTSTSVIQQVPIGSFANVFRPSDAYKAAGEVVSRAAYPALSVAFPRNGSLTAIATTTPSGTWVGLAYGMGLFALLTGTGALFTSPDCVNWTARVSLPAITSRNYTGLAFGSGRFVAIAGGTSGNTTTCYVSTDLINWSAGTMPDANWMSVTYGTQFVAVAYNMTIAATSSDGINWAQRTLPSASGWYRVVYGGGVYFAMHGAGGASSPDGVTWTARVLPGGASWKDLAYGNGAFIVVGAQTSGYGMARSTDGATWVEVQYASLATKVSLDAVGFGNGMHFVVASGANWVSYDGGLTWNIKSSISGSFSAKAIIYGNSRFFSPSASAPTTAALCAFAETTEGTTSPSDDLYIQGTAGQFVRVK